MKIKKRQNISIYILLVICVFLTLTNSCKKDEPIIKKDVVITWANPADIILPTALSATQLNAVCNVPGTFVYTPAIGTVLSIGTAQNLKVDFTPTDAVNNNAATKTVKINVNSIGTVTDYDGNVYNTVVIGTQTWMVENLKTTHYANGTAIPLVNTTSTWDALTSTSKAYCWYNDDLANKATYGALYTWAAAMNGAASTTSNPSGIQGVCPTGWHLPSNAEWTQMENYLADNGHNYDGTTGGGIAKIAKSLASTIGWRSASSTGAVGNTDYPTYRNKSGFTALPGGDRGIDGTFLNIGYYGYWWSASEGYAPGAWLRSVYYHASFVYSLSYYKEFGYSVRCLRD